MRFLDFEFCKFFPTTKDTKSTKGLQNETLDAILELCDVEIEQQASLDARHCS